MTDSTNAAPPLADDAVRAIGKARGPKAFLITLVVDGVSVSLPEGVDSFRLEVRPKYVGRRLDPPVVFEGHVREDERLEIKSFNGGQAYVNREFHP